MEWTNKRCPFCQTNLREEEESYVCSVCGIPHHVDCWRENEGCTTYGCKGKPLDGKLAPEEPTKPDPLPVFFECPRCRTKVPKFSRFCLACGFALTPDAASTPCADVGLPIPSRKNKPEEVIAVTEIPPAQEEDLTGATSTHWSSPYATSEDQAVPLTPSWKPEYQAYIKKNMDYYRSKFDDLHHDRSAWSHPAFWLGTLWFFYRQMYGIGFLSICIISFISFVIPPPLSYILVVLYLIICGANGN